MKGLDTLCFKFTLHVWILKGIPNGVAEEKKGNKRPHVEERLVYPPPHKTPKCGDQFLLTFLEA